MRPTARHLIGLVAVLFVLVACGAPPPAPPATPIPVLPPATLPPPTSVAPPTQTAQQAAGPRLRPPAATYNATLTGFTTDDFAGSGTCAACHVPMLDQAGNDVATPTDWRSTMMANASKDPVWQAKVSSELARLPALQEVIEDKCTRCHMPMAHVQTGVAGGKLAMFGDGFLDPANPLHEAGQDGVSCTLCHQVQGDNLGQEESISGGFIVDTSTDAPDRELFGPYPDPVGELMQASTGFNPVQGTHLPTAEHCATCHDLFTPYVDAAGTILGEFPEQTPYTEWQNSTSGEAGVTCQACHMPRTQGGVVIATVPPGLPQRQPFSQHFFVGGNQYMVGILSEHAAEIGVTAEPAQLARTHARSGEQLSNAATLSVESVAQADDVLTVQVKVGATTGHKFPSSFPSRRVWLHVTVTDAAGAVVFESGQPQEDGSIAGNAADENPAAYEPHYDVISAADQVQIYEPIMGNSDGEVTYTLLRAASYLKDNRLLPEGFDKDRAPAVVGVYGEAAGDDNFTGGSDLVTYEAPLGGAQGPFTVVVDLLYQPLSYQFIRDMLTDETEEVARFGGYHEGADKTPSLVATATAKSQ